MGRVVQSLAGRYIIADDVGTTLDDLAVMRAATSYTAATTPAARQPLGVTAYGVLMAIEAAAAQVLGSHDLAGVRVAVQGLGNVGLPLCRYLHERGAGSSSPTWTLRGPRRRRQASERGWRHRRRSTGRRSRSSPHARWVPSSTTRPSRAYAAGSSAAGRTTSSPWPGTMPCWPHAASPSSRTIWPTPAVSSTSTRRRSTTGPRPCWPRSSASAASRPISWRRRRPRARRRSLWRIGSCATRLQAAAARYRVA